MRGFSPRWLSLREDADAAARNRHLSDQLVQWRCRRGPVRITDLGAGTGANLRYLAPRLGGEQRWRLVDRNPVLLKGILPCLQAWARAHGHAITPQRDGLVIDGGGFTARVHWTQRDLAPPPQALDFQEVDLVTASALLDLASGTWIDGVARACHVNRCAAMFVLSYDGRVCWQPRLEGDVSVIRALNRHQRRDKGLGPALGPDAGRHAGRRFAALGFTVWHGSSDWRLDAGQHALQRSLAAGWVQALLDLEPSASRWARGWLAARTDAMTQARAGLTVGHLDVLALPAEADPPS